MQKTGNCESALLHRLDVTSLLLFNFFFLLLEIEYLVCFKVLQQASLETILKLQMVADWGNASMDIMARIRNEFSRQVPFRIIDLT